MTDLSSFPPNFRNYENADDTVKEFYRKHRRLQTVDYVQRMIKGYCSYTTHDGDNNAD